MWRRNKKGCQRVRGFLYFSDEDDEDYELRENLDSIDDIFESDSSNDDCSDDDLIFEKTVDETVDDEENDASSSNLLFF